METLSLRGARRLALVRAGLLRPDLGGFPASGTGRGVRARRAALAIVQRFGYLQLDTVSIAGARSHALVLLARLDGFDPALGEELLQPGEPLFEYWGHEASWLPLELYPLFEFRRRAFREHPWWGDVVGANPRVADGLLARIADEGPLRSIDMQGEGSRGWWDLKLEKKVATALWSSGELAIAERANFQRSYDLAERVIPAELRAAPFDFEDALEQLLLLALRGHGWATQGTLAATWRLRNLGPQLKGALARLEERGAIVPCALENPGGRPTAGWVRPADLDLADRLDRARPRSDRPVLLSPFDPLLWDRGRVARLFGFEQCLEIFKPAEQRQYGYYCLPALAGEELVGRVDLKAHRAEGRLELLAEHVEEDGLGHSDVRRRRASLRAALARFAEALELESPAGPRC